MAAATSPGASSDDFAPVRFTNRRRGTVALRDRPSRHQAVALRRQNAVVMAARAKRSASCRRPREPASTRRSRPLRPVAASRSCLPSRFLPNAADYFIGRCTPGLEGSLPFVCCSWRATPYRALPTRSCRKQRTTPGTNSHRSLSRTSWMFVAFLLVSYGDCRRLRNILVTIFSSTSPRGSNVRLNLGGPRNGVGGSHAGCAL